MKPCTAPRPWARQRELSELERQGLIQGFKFTHELAWNVFKNYLGEQGLFGIIGSKNATREAFRNGLIHDGEVWLEMIGARNPASHTYNTQVAVEITAQILGRFYPAFTEMEQPFAGLRDQGEETA